MKIDFSQKILQLDGTPMKAEEGKDFTVGMAAVVAIDAVTEETKRLEPKEKYHRGELAARIYRAKEPIKVDVADVALIKDLIGKVYGPHIVHEAWDMLDPEGTEPDPPEPTPTIPSGN